MNGHNSNAQSTHGSLDTAGMSLAQVLDQAFDGYRAGDVARAEACCKQVLAQVPDHADALQLMASILCTRDAFDQAISFYNRAIEQAPAHAPLYHSLGVALKRTGQLDQAVTQFEKAIDLRPDYTAALSHLSLVRMEQAKWTQAQAVLTKALSLKPDSVELHNNLGNVLMELARFDQAQTEFEHALRIDPECAQAHHNLSLVLLLKSCFETGWAEYEWRWKNPAFSTPRRPFTQSCWHGSTENVGTLLVWCEQGIGDEAQFASLLPFLQSLGISITLECDARLVCLFARSFPGLTVVPRTNPPHALLDDPAITHQIPIASLPHVLKRDFDQIVSIQPYLQPDPEKRNQFRAKYKTPGDSLLVGISFTSKNTQQGPQRSVSLDQWGPILRTPGMRFVNLQYGDCTAALNQARDLFGVDIVQDTQVNPLTDLDTFCAQIAAMDLVISADNSTIHFAGALGIDVWAMLPRVPDWRWGLASRTTPWYATMRLFRQTELGQWQAVVTHIAEELKVWKDLE